MEEKDSKTSKSPQKWIQRLSCFAKPKSSHERNTLYLIKHFRQKPKGIKGNKSSNLDIYLSEKIINYIRNLDSISSVKSSYFNNLNFSNQPQITRHFHQILSEGDKQRFYKIMLLSRELDGIYLASSNVATILNKSGFSFDNQNLQNIKIPYADLSNNSFIKTNFSNSDLRYVDFTSSLVAFSDFSNCKMSESKLEIAIFEPKDREVVEKITISKCEKYVASLNSMKILAKRCFVSIFSVDQSIEINYLQLANYRIEISDIKFSSYSSALYILYCKEELVIWDFIENTSKVIKLENKIPSLMSAFSDYMLAYSIPGFIKVISLFGFQTIWQVKAGKKLGYQVKNISDKFLLGKKGNSIKHTIWSIELGIKYKKVKAEFMRFCGDFYITINKDVLEIVKLDSGESIWKIRDPNYKYISAGNNFLASFKGNEILIIDIQKQALLEYSYFNEFWHNNGWLNLFKTGFFGLKNDTKILKLSNFSDTIKPRKCNNTISSMFCTENTITVFWLGLMKIINIDTKEVTILSIPNSLQPKSMVCSDDMCIFYIDSVIEIWSLQAQKLIKQIKTFERCSGVQLSLDKKQFSLNFHSKKSFLIYSIESGEIIHTIKYDNVYITCYRFSGKHLIFKINKKIVIWDQENENCEYVHTGFNIKDIEISPCGRWAAFHNEIKKNEVILFSIDTKLFTVIAHGKDELINDFLHFSPCGNYLAIASAYNIMIWESATGIKIAKTGGVFPEIQKFSYSECGKYIASYVKEDLILIWNAEEGLGQFKAGNGVDLDINLSLDRAIIANATVFSGNIFSEISYVDEIKHIK
ncbi:unnamed protein product [Blepharisma stoltei]|uniref:Uncharacterized protein n=1 Tax=Blepharisma stoltei TaxID=1481888 RepID=A0AAU9IC05_9CILI|nr:unnamed protein product [Blepharisma stoltei]